MAHAAIGIDLGTTHCRVAVWRDGRLEVIPNEIGNLLTPSCVAFVGGERLLGDAAKSQVTREPKATICSAKALVGCPFSSLAVRRFRKNSLCSVVSTAQGVPAVAVAGRSHALLPTELLAEVLSHARRAAELHLDRAVSRAVLVVPACFDYAQRLAIKAAGELAGLEVLSLVTDTAAAAVAYAFDRTGTSGRCNVLFFDLGGGSLSTALATVDGSHVEMKAAAGNPYLGGDDIDSRMVDHFLKEFHLRHSRDLSSHPRAMSRLRVACEGAKRTLSTAAEASIELDFLLDSITFRTSMARAKFETLNGSLFLAVLPPCEAALRKAGLTKAAVHDVVLVGAGSRIPKVQELLVEFFDGKVLNRSLNMDTASAQGAAIQAAILTQGLVRDLFLVEVARSTLSIGVANGALYPLVRRNAIIPIVKSVVFTTYNDDQVCARIPVYSGDQPLVEKNQLLGLVYLNGIVPASRGVSEIEVTFDVGGDGLLTVLAEESRGSRVKVKATFTHSNGALTIQHSPSSAANPDPSCSTPERGWLVPYHMRSAGTGAPVPPHHSAASSSQASKRPSAASPQSIEHAPRRRRLDEVEGSTPLSDLQRSVRREMERRLGNMDADWADSTLPSAFRELWEVLQAAHEGKIWQVSDFSTLRRRVDAVRQQLAAQQESIRIVVASLQPTGGSPQLAALCTAEAARDQARRQLCDVLEAAGTELLGGIRTADGSCPTAVGLEAYKGELWKAGTTLFSLLERCTACCNEAEERRIGRLNCGQPGPDSITVEEARQAWEAWRVQAPLRAIQRATDAALRELDAAVHRPGQGMPLDPEPALRRRAGEGPEEWDPAAHFPLHAVLGGARGLLARREAEFPAVQAVHEQLAAWHAEKIALKEVLAAAKAKEGLLRDLQRAREAWEAAAAALAGMAADFPELAVHVAARYPTPPS